MGYAQLVAVSSCAGDVVYRYQGCAAQVQVQVWPNNFNAYPLHGQGQPLYCWEDALPLFGRRGKDYLLTSELAFTFTVKRLKSKRNVLQPTATVLEAPAPAPVRYVDERAWTCCCAPLTAPEGRPLICRARWKEAVA